MSSVGSQAFALGAVTGLAGSVIGIFLDFWSSRRFCRRNHGGHDPSALFCSVCGARL